MSTIVIVSIAALGGALPALAWAWFWLREDSDHHEPRQLIAATFLAGMVTVAFVVPIQNFIAPSVKYIGNFFLHLNPENALILVFAAWSVIEEAAKYIAAYFVVLRRPENHQPIDAVIFMILVALGFAAVENTLFLIEPLRNGNFSEAVLTGNLRFIGATLLHVFSSGLIGVALGLSFYRPAYIRHMYAALAVILAAVLHSGFNALILKVQDEHLLRTFLFVWIGVVVMLALIERTKRFDRGREQLMVRT